MNEYELILLTPHPQRAAARERARDRRDLALDFRGERPRGQQRVLHLLRSPPKPRPRGMRVRNEKKNAVKNAFAVDYESSQGPRWRQGHLGLS